MQEDFDGSALRELLTPAVADRGRTSAPTDAIVIAGRRRVVGRRSAVAGGALVIVAAVPLAATAIAAGPDKAAVTSATGKTGSGTGTGTGSGGKGTTPGVVAPSRTDAKTKAEAENKAHESAPPAKTNRAGSLPTHPTLLGSGVIEGKHWSISGVASGGNNALTANDQCLKLIVSEDGRMPDPSLGDRLLYCLPGSAPGNYMLEEMQYDIQGGAGNVAIGTVRADVVKIVARVGGAAPLTIATVPAPGAPDSAIFLIPASGITPSIAFDEYDAQGVKIGSWDNSAPNPTKH
ncbi:hypothetical protein ABH935_008172 [Catenulispora sp. GAS73]|uniref:hypothetical protein n=1 Tax=Catenulispora sp. GAS73 TaxID=3156269 RepID=UPI003517D4AC